MKNRKIAGVEPLSLFCSNFQLVTKLEKGSAYPLHSETTLEIQPPPTTTITTTTTTTTIIHPSCSKQLFTNVLLERRTGHRRRKERRVSLARVPPRNHVPPINTIDYWASLNLQTQGRKRLAFTIKQKMKIIQEIERGKSKSDVARELGLASSTVATIWKNRESIAESWRNRDMMQHSDVEDSVAKKSGLSSSSSNLASVTSLVTNNTVLNTVNTTNSSTTGTTLPTAIVVAPPQVQVVPPPPPPPLPLPTTSATVVPSTSQPTQLSTPPISSTMSTGTTTTTNASMDNTQQAQTQTQSQELLEVRCRMTPPDPSPKYPQITRKNRVTNPKILSALDHPFQGNLPSRVASSRFLVIFRWNSRWNCGWWGIHKQWVFDLELDSKFLNQMTLL